MPIIHDNFTDITPSIPNSERIISVKSTKLGVDGTISLTELEKAVQRDKWKQDPILWVKERLGEFLWSKQKSILQSISQCKQTAVYSCHRIGKSFLAARVAAWWIDIHKPGEAIVVTSSHSAVQVKAAIWREIGRIHAKYKFPGRMNQAEWYMTMPAGNEELVAFGRKPADDDTTAFQGIYSRYVLVLIDEACYIAKPLWDGVRTLLSNEDSKAVAWGNPDDVDTEFGRICSPGSGWEAIQIGYEDTPNFTGEEVPENVKNLLIGPGWVQDTIKLYGKENPYTISKVYGQFPERSQDNMSLFSIRLIKEAQEANLEKSGPRELGVDVGGGGNKNIIAFRHGPVVRIIKEDQNPDTMQTLSNVIECLRETKADSAKVDEIGIGHGAVDRAKEIASDQEIKKQTPERARLAGLISGVNVGSQAQDKEQFVNLRSEGYWGLFLRAQEGNLDIDPEDEELAAQLMAIRYKRSAGRIQIESKDDMRRRKVPSPDKADAVMLAYLDPPKEPGKKRVRTGW